MNTEQLQKMTIIHRIMCEYYSEDFIVNHRQRTAAERRMMFSYIAKMLIPSITDSTIGEYVCRNRSTVIYYIQHIKDLCYVDGACVADIQYIKARCIEEFELCEIGIMAQTYYEI